MDQRPLPSPKCTCNHMWTCYLLYSILWVADIDWEAIDDNGKPAWRCIVCRDGRKVPYDKTRQHEASATHMDLVEIREREQRLDAEEPTEAQIPGALPPYLALVDSGTRSLLQSLSAGAVTVNRDDPVSDSSPASPEHSPIPGWGLFEVHGDTDLALSAEEHGIALIAKSLLDRFEEMSVGSDEAAEERSDDEAGNEIPEPIITGKKQICQFYLMLKWSLGNDDSIGSEPPRKRSHNVEKDDSLDPSAKWFPWRDKIVRVCFN